MSSLVYIILQNDKVNKFGVLSIMELLSLSSNLLPGLELEIEIEIQAATYCIHP